MHTIKKGKLFTRALMVLAIALMLVPVTFAADAPPNPEGPGSWMVDIGTLSATPPGETQPGITLDTCWGPIEPDTHGGGWGGIGSEPGKCRTTWGFTEGLDPIPPGPGCPRCAAITYSYSVPVVPTELEMRVLDGGSDDSFTVTVDGNLVFTWVGELGGELWYVHDIDLTGIGPDYLGMSMGTDHTVEICAVGPAGTYWSPYGQLGVDWVTLTAADGVDIGVEASEAGHSLTGWGPIEPATHGGNWGLTGPTGQVDNCRVIWDQSDDDPTAYVTLDNNYPADGVLGLKMRHLDGIADDSFKVEVKDNTDAWVEVGHYYDKKEGIAEPITDETWWVSFFDIDYVDLDAGADIEVKLTATYPHQWSGFNTFGQVGFDWIVLTDPPAPEPTNHPPDILADVLDYVDIGEPTSEAAYSLTNWGPVEPETHPGHWGYPDHNYGGDVPPGDGDGNCRVVSSSGSGDWASFDMDFGPANDEKFLLLKHLDGHAKDSFNVYIDDMGNPPIYQYVGNDDSAEYWFLAQVPVNLTGVHTVYLESTETHWTGWDTLGQVAFTWAAVVRKHITVPESQATVTINGMARDNFDPAPSLGYSTGETYTYPVGNTIVTLTASDESGNVSTGTVVVTVMGDSPPQNPCANPLDHVDIGNPPSEVGYNLQGWGPIEPDSHPSNWGGMTPGNEQCRVIWAPVETPPDPPPEHRCATLELDFGSDPDPKMLLLRHLDGIADDSFDVYIDEFLVGHYTDVSPTEVWRTFSLNVDPSLTGIHTVRLCATGTAWSGWDTYGQVGFDWIEVCPGDCVYEYGYVDIGNPPSEVGHNLQGWGPIEPDANGGNWGGFGPDEPYKGDCRVTWESPAGDRCAEVDIDFGCLAGDKTLVLRHLDGLADDSYDVFIDGIFVGHYDDISPTEVWKNFNLSVDPGLTGVHTVRLCATGDEWAHFDTWGQVGFDWIKVCGQVGMYWKADYPDYAVSGMPDFDQKQFEPGLCGPTAVANCLWWFDSKFESEDTMPPAINDTYPLVQAYGPHDDHDPQNVVPLVSDLAGLMNTGPFGTNVFDMEIGIREYLIQKDLRRHFYEHTQEMPTFEWVEAEVERSQDVILLLGFYEAVGDQFERRGGHYVTVAGVDSINMEIAFSDPFRDNAGLGAPGRVRDGVMTSHSPYGTHGHGIHNDAGNVSHDMYLVMLDSPTPGGVWQVLDYADPDMVLNFLGLNPHPWIDTIPGFYDGPIFTEVEYAVAISPKPYLWLEPDDDTINVGAEADVDVMITVNEMCGVEFDLYFDPELLEVVDADSGTAGTQISVGSLWAGKDYDVIQNEVNDGDGIIQFAAYLRGHDYCPSNFYDDHVAQIKFHGIGGGVSPLNLDKVIVGTTDGGNIEPVFLDDGTLTVLGYGTIEGSVEVQGRPGHWDGAEIEVSGPGGTYNTVTDSDGNWSISGILAGDYDVAVEMARYLDGEKTGVSVGAGGPTDVGQVKVLGGDCNDTPPGVPDDYIDILDAIILGGAFDSVPGDTNWNARADINDSGNVNILDAVLLGENWNQGSPVPW